MTSAIWGRTPNIKLGLLEFNFPNWADDANANTQLIDAALGIAGIAIGGVWLNSTEYQAGILVVDQDDNSLWRCQTTHISSPTPAIFVEERAERPGLWADTADILNQQGQWVTGKIYYPNDIVYDGYLWAMAARQFTSSETIEVDIIAGNFVVITDSTAAVDACANSATSATNSANSADISEANAALSASNANTFALSAGNSASAASTSAASAQSSEDDAEAAAAAAAASLAAMTPDAPSTGIYYGRRNGGWSAVTQEAPADGIVYARKSGNWVPATGAMIVSDAPPSAPLANGQLWFESDSGNTFMWYTQPSDPDSSQWIHVSGFSALVPGGGGGIAEAPSDGLIYARRNNSWLEIGASGGVPEAPIDGKQYVRKNAAWAEVIIPTIPAMPFVFDTNGDAVCKFGASIVVRIKSSGLILTKDDVEVFSVSV